MSVRAVVVISFVLLGAARPAEAEQPAGGGQGQVAAAEAYDRGTAAYLARDFAAAARWFETAFRLAPSSAALVQAARSHDRAGDLARAASLAIQLDGRDDATPELMAAVAPLIARAAQELLRVDVQCERCTLEVEGRVWSFTSIFLAPSREHALTIHFETGDVERVVSGEAGTERSLRVEAPPAPHVPTPPAPLAPSPRRDEGPRGLSPTYTWIGIGLTTVLTGATIASGLDTLAGVDDYEAMPTQAGLDAGRDKELRTNILLGAAIAVGATTAALALVATEWGGDTAARDRSDAALSAWATPHDAGVSLTGRF